MSAQQSTKEKKFSGFVKPESNFFKMPNEWTDITAGMTSLAELKIVEYVLKHTWGYQEFGIAKRITTDEFMHGRKRKDGTRIDQGTGLSNRSVIDGLRRAIEDGYLLEEVDDRDKARIKKYYTLRMSFQGEGPEANETEEPEEDVKIIQPDVKNLHSGVKYLHSRSVKSSQRTEKDTLERQQQQENKEKDNNSSGEQDKNHDVVVALIEKGISKKVAQRIAHRYNRQRIFEKIEFLEYLQKTDPNKVANPRGWLRRAIEDDYGKPDGFKSRAEREAEAAAAEKRRQAIIEQEKQRAAQEEEKREQERREREGQLAQLRRDYKTSEATQKVWSEWKSQVRARTTLGKSLVLNDCELLALQDTRVVLWVATDYAVKEFNRLHAPTIRKLAAKHLKIPLTAVDIKLITSAQHTEDTDP